MFHHKFTCIPDVEKTSCFPSFSPFQYIYHDMLPPSLLSFEGMLVGAGFWSVFADKRGRRNAFVMSLACVFVGGVLSALSSSLALLCLFRVVVGFGVGGEWGKDARTHSRMHSRGPLPAWTRDARINLIQTGGTQGNGSPAPPRSPHVYCSLHVFLARHRLPHR